MNGDGVLDVPEFMMMILGRLEGPRREAAEKAFEKFDPSGRGFVQYRTLRDAFDGKRHPDFCNGKKTDEEVITDFLENLEIHHNTFNNFEKNDKVTKSEFMEFYRTLSPNYEEDNQFISMVRGVWGVKNDNPDVSARGWAGGKEDA